MKASEARLNTLLKKSDIRFVIPVYQRNYDWTTKECKILLSDIIKAGELEREHFIGSIVYVGDNSPKTDIQELIVVDGQQRLTTITLIYLRLFKLAKKMENSDLKDKIYEHFLINKFAKDNEDKIKLKLTENNHIDLKAILYDNDISNEKSNIIDNFMYFSEEIDDNNFDLVYKGLDYLSFVDMFLDKKEDDPQRIFESLNSTGLALSQGDLIRNYILMQLDSNRQDYIYNHYWLPIENSSRDEDLSKNLVSDFIRDFMTCEYGKITNKSNVYEEFKEHYSSLTMESKENYLKKLKEYSIYYNKLINPKNESNIGIQTALSRIKNLEVNVSYPFFMQVYNDYINNKITSKLFIEVINLIESFIFRRFICDIGTNSLNKIFMTLYKEVDINNYYDSIAINLCSRLNHQRFPNDEEVKSKLREKDIYNSIKNIKIMYLFNRLEQGNGDSIINFEETDLTIEHIFPQNPCVEWENDLSKDEYNKLMSQCHTIGNLTISANNKGLGNKTFQEKKYMNIDNKEQGYIYSKLWLNSYLCEVDEWNLENMNTRLDKLTERFLNVWSYPKHKVSFKVYSEVNIFDAEDPTNKKLDYFIFEDKKQYLSEISKLFTYVIKDLFYKNKDTFFSKEIKSILKITRNKNDLRSDYPINVDNIYYIENNFSNKEKFMILKKLLRIFKMEEELYIKYKN